MTQPATSTADAVTQFVHPLANGLTLLGERIPGVRSAGVTLLVPMGAASEPVGKNGASSILSDWMMRGAGTRDSRQLNDFLDARGVQRSSQPETMFLRFSAQMLSRNLLAVLPIYADIVRRPQLSEDGFGPAQDLALQQLDSIEDEPSSKLMLMLRRAFFGEPYGRPTVGVAEEIEACTPESLRADVKQRCTPRGAILSIAGMFDPDDLRAAVEDAFGTWTGPAVNLPNVTAPKGGVVHLSQETNQVQIGLAYAAVPESDQRAKYLHMLLAILSGGMGSRLFSEIREKEGLCYSVQAGYAPLRQAGAVLGYAGTSPERAQQTLDAFIRELRRVAAGVSAEELERAKVGMKSRAIMQGESSGSRSGALAYDFYHLGKPRTLAEVREEIESVTLRDLNLFAAATPLAGLTVATIGPTPLHVAGLAQTEAAR
jgi:predicted Zn-dependent peptidase